MTTLDSWDPLPEGAQDSKEPSIAPNILLHRSMTPHCLRPLNTSKSIRGHYPTLMYLTANTSQECKKKGEKEKKKKEDKT